MDDLTFDQKISMLALAKTKEERAGLIKRFSTNAEFFVGVNARTMPLAQYMELKKDKFRQVANRAKVLRDSMQNRGWTDKKYQKYMAEIPEDLFLERPEFNAHLPQDVLKKNIQDFLSKYPQFRVDK